MSVEGIYVHVDAVSALYKILSQPSQGVFIPFSQLRTLRRDEYGDVMLEDWGRLLESIKCGKKSQLPSNSYGSENNSEKVADDAKAAKRRKLDNTLAHGTYLHLFQRAISIVSERNTVWGLSLRDASNLCLLNKRVRVSLLPQLINEIKSLLKRFQASVLPPTIKIDDENAPHIYKWYKTKCDISDVFDCPFCKSSDNSSLIIIYSTVRSRHRERYTIPNCGELDGSKIDANENFFPGVRYGLALYCHSCSVRIFFAHMPVNEKAQMQAYIKACFQETKNLFTCPNCDMLVCSKPSLCYHCLGDICEQCTDAHFAEDGPDCRKTS